MDTTVLSPTSYWWTTFFHEENRKWKGKKSKVCSKCFSYVRLFATPWTVTCQASQSMGYSRQEYWSGLPCLPPKDLPGPGVKLMSLTSSAMVDGFFTTGSSWEGTFPHFCLICFSVVVFIHKTGSHFLSF